jgi:hypothetical protein
MDTNGNGKTHRGKPFSPGQSGNPNGKPKGARNRVTLFVENLLEGDVEAVTRKLVEQAKQGDPTAMKIFFDRIYPILRSQPIRLNLPAKINTAQEALEASNEVLTAMGRGEISPMDAEQAGSVIRTHMDTISLCEIKKEIEEIRSEIEWITNERNGDAAL